MENINLGMHLKFFDIFLKYQIFLNAFIYIQISLVKIKYK